MYEKKGNVRNNWNWNFWNATDLVMTFWLHSQLMLWTITVWDYFFIAHRANLSNESMVSNKIVTLNLTHVSIVKEKNLLSEWVSVSVYSVLSLQLCWNITLNKLVRQPMQLTTKV